MCTAVWGEKWLVWMGQIVWSCTLTPCSSSSGGGLSCGWDGEGSGLVPMQHLAPQHLSLQWMWLIMWPSLSQRPELCGFVLDTSASVL